MIERSSQDVSFDEQCHNEEIDGSLNHLAKNMKIHTQKHT